MALVNGLTKEAMEVIRDDMVVDADIVGDSLHITRHSGDEENLGVVVGTPPGTALFFSTSTSMTAPGDTTIRFNNATPTSVTQIAISTVGIFGQNLKAWLLTCLNGTITFGERGPRQYLFQVTAIVDNTTWLRLTVTPVFCDNQPANGQLLFVNISAKGATGATGPAGTSTTSWSDSVTYAVGDVVGYMGRMWRCIQGGGVNKSPYIFQTYWTPLSARESLSWVQLDPNFSGDTHSTAWETFWKTGTVTSVGLTTTAGEFETGLQALKIVLTSGSSQRLYEKVENVIFKDQVAVIKVRAKLRVAIVGSATIEGQLLQNDFVSSPTPLATGVATTGSVEGAQTLTTSWQTFTFTMTAVDNKLRGIVNIIASKTGTGSADVLIDRITTTVVENRFMVDTGLINFPFASGWSQYPGWDPAQYERKNGIVYLTGLVIGPADYASTRKLVGQLPAGFRPKGAKHVPIAVNAQFGVLNIMTTGDVQWNSSPAGFPTGWMSLEVPPWVAAA